MKNNELSEAIADGVCDGFFRIVIWLAIGAGWLWLLNGLTGCAMDSTDQSARHPSGFTLMTDAETGCQYLKAGSGLAPRLDASGKHICQKTDGRGS